MKSTVKKIIIGCFGLLLVVLIMMALLLTVSHNRGVAEAERAWQEYTPPEIIDFGQTRSLVVLPLVNWHTARDDLQGEMGVAYLVRTDSLTILFDVGHNAEEVDPSPLLHNMQELEVSPADIDIIFLSHNHFDHVGGKRWEQAHTFSLTNEQIALQDVEVYTPVPMTYPGLEPIHTPEPKVLAPGLATTGTIPRRLFVGPIEEQALVVNVEDRGLVLIVGCGHQTLPKLLQRTEAVFDEPLYGLLGDLHYPVPEGRLNVLGINAQRRFASGDAPWRPLSEDDIQRNIAMLKAYDPGVVALGGHDSSDEVIAQFRQVFGPAYRDVRVGEWISVAEAAAVDE